MPYVCSICPSYAITLLTTNLENMHPEQDKAYSERQTYGSKVI